MVRRLDLLLPVLQAEDVVRLQMILLNHLLRVRVGQMVNFYETVFCILRKTGFSVLYA